MKAVNFDFGSSTIKSLHVPFGEKNVKIGPLDPQIIGLPAIFKQEGLAVASIARDDPSTLPGDDPLIAPACTATAMRGKLGWDGNLKPKLAIMRQCTSVTDRQTDTGIVA